MTESQPSSDPAASHELATFGAGCFWCVEAVFAQVDGVAHVASGFMGGQTDNPSYRDVCGGDSGHAEVVQIQFDPSRVTYADLLAWLWRLHDPTTLNRQGADVGTQYRSAIFTHSDAQRATALESRAELDVSDAFTDPVVTEVVDASAFYAAEAEHDDYYKRNRDQGYCRMVIAPKLRKLGIED